MTTGGTTVVGRIEFSGGFTPHTADRMNLGADQIFIPPGYTVEKPIRTLDEFFARAPIKPPNKQSFYWLIEVKFDGDERAPRYFTGECEPGWHGCTTIRADLAQKYSSKCLAQIDILKLAPRLIGEWVAREHGFS